MQSFNFNSIFAVELIFLIYKNFKLSGWIVTNSNYAKLCLDTLLVSASATLDRLPDPSDHNLRLVWHL